MQAQKLFAEGQKLHQKGKKFEALQRYERALKTDPNFALAQIFKAIILLEVGKPFEALEEAEKSISNMKKPDLAILVNYGVILKNLGRLDEAANAYEQVLQINPNILSAKSNLATIYLVQGRLDEAESKFQELASVMEEPAPWLNLARIALLRNKTTEVEEYIARAEDFDMTHPDCALLRGKLALTEADYGLAYKHVVKCLAISPSHRDAWLLLQQIDSEYYEFEEVSARLDQLSKMNVQSATVLSIAVDICRKHWLWTALPKLEEMLSNALLNSLDKIPTTADIFTLLGAAVPQRAHLAAASKCWQSITQLAPRLASVPHPSIENRKLRVAFISSDLRGHAIGYLVVGLFERLPKEKTEWWAYSNALAESSSVRGRLRDNFDRFINISKLDDQQLAERIKEDKIDVLIDLNQMTAETRAPVFAYRPAPVQIQWLGMPGTLGAGSDVDYIIVDPWVVDECNADGFSECLLMLPRSYQPNDHVHPNLSLCPTRFDAGLPQDAIVFGVFNQFYKFSPDTLLLWGKIFKEVSEAVLWLLAPKNEHLKKQILKELGRCGISAERVIFAEHKSQEEHLARLQWMDLVLDTWPYNAHTTCSDALRAGVPVLTFPQDTFASRVAAGILHTAGLDKWVARTSDEYVDMAIQYGKLNRLEMDRVKKDAKERYWKSEMVDNEALGSMFEKIVKHVYERAERGAHPTSIKMLKNGDFEPLHFGRQDITSPNRIEPVADDKNYQDKKARLELINSKNKDKELGNLPSWASEITRTGSKARLKNLAVLQKSIIRLLEPPLMIDIGAAPEGLVGHEVLADAGLIKVLGFEPDPECFAKLEETPNSSFVNCALGDGKTHDLHICNASGMNSLLRPNKEWLGLFPGFEKWGGVKEKMPVSTLKLDDVKQAVGARFAKLDVQGAEKLILENGISILNQLSILQIESSPTPLYHDEPSFFEIGYWLQKQGFVLHTLSNENKRCMKPYGSDDNPYTGKNHIFQVDAVFIPNPLSWAGLEAERLESLAFISHAMYRSHDLAMKALDVLDSRDNGSRVADYRDYLDIAGLAA